MNVKHVLAIVLFCVPIQTVWAECSGQKAMIIFSNGVEFDSLSAEKSKNRLEKTVIDSPFVNPDCLSFDYVHNSDPGANTVLTAIIQKAQEQGWTLPEFWELFFLVDPFVPKLWFADLINEWFASPEMAQALQTVVNNQVQEHLAKYREAIAQGFQIILVPHSQGNLSANTEWGQMTPEEQIRTHIVAIASPSDDVADGGPYTTLEEDGIAGLFPFALPANASNGNDCTLLGNWYCHAFKESYLTGQNSRDRIIGNIVTLLPEDVPTPATSTLSGTVYYTDDSNEEIIPDNVRVILTVTDTGEIRGIVMTDTAGRYHFTNQAPCQCTLTAENPSGFGRIEVILPILGAEVTQDILFHSHSL